MSENPHEPGSLVANPAAVAVIFVAIVLTALVAILKTTSVAALIFAGSAATFLPIGIGAGLVGLTVVNIVGGAFLGYRATISDPPAVNAVILPIAIGAIVAGMPDASPETLSATLLLTIAIATGATGLAFLLAGTLRLGFVIRFVPYPVMAGFLGSSGCIVLINGLGLVSEQAGGIGSLAAVTSWLPVLVIAIIMKLAVSRFGAVSFPILAIAVFVLFHIALLASGISITEAKQRGLLFGNLDFEGGIPFGIAVADMANADFGAIFEQWKSILTLAALSLLGAPLSASGIEAMTRRQVPMDRELSALGLGNLLSGLGGGFIASHSMSSTLLAKTLSNSDSWLLATGIGLLCGLTLIGGASLLTLVPVVLSGALLVYIAIELILHWLWQGFRRMPLQDYLVVVLIVVIALVAGFLEAVAVGIAAAGIVFLFTYARLDVVRSRLTGRVRQSTTERDAATRAELNKLGDMVRIFELQGYVFFGTTYSLLQEIEKAIDSYKVSPHAVIVDFRRVQGIDISAVFALERLATLCNDNGAALYLSGLSPELRKLIERAELGARFVLSHTLDDTLSEIEDTLLSEFGAPACSGAGDPLAALVKRISDDGHDNLFPQEQMAKGAAVFQQGDPSDSIVLLESGSLSALVGNDDGTAIQVATFRPGAIAGEIGFYGDMPRSATVIATSDSVIRRLTREGCEELGLRSPELAREFDRIAAAFLARRLAQTTSLLRHVAK